MEQSWFTKTFNLPPKASKQEVIDVIDKINIARGDSLKSNFNDYKYSGGSYRSSDQSINFPTEYPKRETVLHELTHYLDYNSPDPKMKHRTSVSNSMMGDVPVSWENMMRRIMPEMLEGMQLKPGYGYDEAEVLARMAEPQYRGGKYEILHDLVDEIKRSSKSITENYSDTQRRFDSHDNIIDIVKDLNLYNKGLQTSKSLWEDLDIQSSFKDEAISNIESRQQYLRDQNR